MGKMGNGGLLAGSPQREAACVVRRIGDAGLIDSAKSRSPVSSIETGSLVPGVLVASLDGVSERS